MEQMGPLSFGNGQSTSLQPLMHFRHAPMLSEAPGANEGNHIQTKFAMRQGPPSFFFGMIADMILWARGSMTLADRYAQLKDAFQCDHLSPTVVGHPPAIATLGTGRLQRPQGSRELRFGLGGSQGHRLPPCFNKGQHFHLNVHPLSRRVFRSAKNYVGNLSWMSFSSRAPRYLSCDL